MRLFITGVPGTGKTTLAKFLGKKLHFPVFSDKTIAKQAHAWKKEQNDFVVTIPRFQQKLRQSVLAHPNGIWEGHLLAEIRVPGIDHVILVETKPDVLIKRLRQRKYSWIKTLDNVWAQEQDHCGKLVEKHFPKRVIRVDSTKTIKATVSLVLSQLKSKQTKIK